MVFNYNSDYLQLFTCGGYGNIFEFNFPPGLDIVVPNILFKTMIEDTIESAASIKQEILINCILCKYYSHTINPYIIDVGIIDDNIAVSLPRFNMDFDDYSYHFANDHYINNNTNRQTFYLRLLKELLLNLKQLHVLDILHKDIGLGNILINVDENGYLKDVVISDFGVSLFGRKCQNVQIGSSSYETYKDEKMKMDFSMDIYAIACTMYLFASNVIGYDDDIYTCPPIYKLLKKNYEDIIQECGYKFYYILECMLRPKLLRPYIDQIITLIDSNDTDLKFEHIYNSNDFFTENFHIYVNNMVIKPSIDSMDNKLHYYFTNEQLDQLYN